MANIFDTLKVGPFEAAHRIVMAPMTRARATRKHVPTEVMIEYYRQRADAGFIITEATGISQEGVGWPFAPGIWSEEQVEAWKPIVAAVHAKGGKIISQLWHMGRAAHSNVTGTEVIAPSALAMPGEIHTYAGKLPAETPRAVTKEDIARILDDYRRAARNAIRAGFDGVQIHAANGYLLDEFLRDSANKRTDEYGGSIENRARLLDEVVAAVVETVGAERTGVRLSPNGDTYGVIDSNPEPLFRHVAAVLEKHKVAFVELREPGPDHTFGPTEQPKQNAVIRSVYTGVLGLNQEYSFADAQETVASGKADFIAWARPFISNPDLVDRFRKGLPLAKDDVRTWYSQGPEGYTDYPTYQEIEVQA